jgi:cell division protein FtsI/penicillin-binding protein 2
MATVAAAIINDGKAPQPYMLEAIRRPGAEAWTPTEEIRTSTPLMTADTALQLRTLLLSHIEPSSLGGHSALAYSGDQTQVWFVGFSTAGIAVAVIIEDSDDAALAQEIGITALEAATP